MIGSNARVGLLTSDLAGSIRNRSLVGVVDFFHPRRKKNWNEQRPQASQNYCGNDSGNDNFARRFHTRIDTTRRCFGINQNGKVYSTWVRG
jgi:hypothetical protein